jgi:hypothetical protein
MYRHMDKRFFTTPTNFFRHAGGELRPNRRSRCREWRLICDLCIEVRSVARIAICLAAMRPTMKVITRIKNLAKRKAHLVWALLTLLIGVFLLANLAKSAP